MSAFSIVFATGIGTGTLAGLVGGSIPQLLLHARRGNHLVDGIRLVLIAASLVALLGVLPVSRLKLCVPADVGQTKRPIFHPFLTRFLPPAIRALEHCHRFIYSICSRLLSKATRPIAPTCWARLFCVAVR